MFQLSKPWSQTYRNGCMLLISLMILWVFFDIQAWAQTVSLMPNSPPPIAMAIYSFSPQTSADPSQTNVSQVIMNDLTMSGRFNVMPMAFDDTLDPLSTAQQKQWQQLALSDVLTGSIHQEMDGHFSVEAKLMDVATHALLWHQTYHVSKEKLRFTAHQISNQIFEKLTNTPGIFTTKIAYIHVLGHAPGAKQYRLEVCDVDGFDPQVLVVSSMPLMSPTWSPDGQQIAYVSFEHQKATVYVQNVVDGSRIKISDEPGLNQAPAFSHDGQSLALVQTIDGYPHIALMSLNTGKITPLTSGDFEDTEPHFSFDDQSIIFTSTREGGNQIYAMDLKTMAVKRITYQGTYNASANFIPTLTSIVYLHKDHGIFSIAKQPLEDSDNVKIVDKHDSDASPSVAPNGQMIVLSQSFQGQRVLVVVSQDGLAKTRLPALMGDAQDPVWSPLFTQDLAQKFGEI